MKSSKMLATPDAEGLLCKQFNPINSEHKTAIINTLKQYYYNSPRSIKNIAKEIDGISASTLWRIITNKAKNPHPKTLYRLYRFLNKERWIKVYEGEKKYGNWINYTVRKIKGWNPIKSFKFKG